MSTDPPDFLERAAAEILKRVRALERPSKRSEANARTKELHNVKLQALKILESAMFLGYPAPSLVMVFDRLLPGKSALQQDNEFSRSFSAWHVAMVYDAANFGASDRKIAEVYARAAGFDKSVANYKKQAGERRKSTRWQRYVKAFRADGNAAKMYEALVNGLQDDDY